MSIPQDPLYPMPSPFPPPAAIAAPAGLSDFDERYIGPLLSAWRIHDQSERFQQRVLKVLQELGAEALLSLVDARLEVRILPDRGLGVWAFYPFYKTLYNARRFSMAPVPLVKPNFMTTVLLQFNAREFEKQDAQRARSDLQKHLGRALLWLRSPAAPNEDSDARREWRGPAFVSRRSGRRRNNLHGVG